MRIRGYRSSEISTFEAQTQSTDSYILKNPAADVRPQASIPKVVKPISFTILKHCGWGKKIDQRATKYPGSQDKV